MSKFLWNYCQNFGILLDIPKLITEGKVEKIGCGLGKFLKINNLEERLLRIQEYMISKVNEKSKQIMTKNLSL